MANLLDQLRYDNDKQLNIVILERLHEIKESQAKIEKKIEAITETQINYVVKVEKLETAFKIKSGIFGVVGGLIASIALFIAKIYNQ